jgi:hypothetical protein
MSSSDQMPPFEDGDMSHEQSNASTDATKEHSTVATVHEDDTTSPTVQQDTRMSPFTDNSSHLSKKANIFSLDNSNQSATLPVEVDTNLDNKAEPEVYKALIRITQSLNSCF